MNLYLAGPMTGLPEFNYPAFRTTAARLRDAGFVVTSPVDNGLAPDAPWAAHMRVDTKLLLECDGVALLNGWSESKGAQFERHVAVTLGIWCQPVGVWLGMARALRASLEADHTQRLLRFAEGATA